MKRLPWLLFVLVSGTALLALAGEEGPDFADDSFADFAGGTLPDGGPMPYA